LGKQILITFGLRKEGWNGQQEKMELDWAGSSPAVRCSFLGYLCGHALELIMGESKHLEVPILVGIAVIGGLWFFFNRSRRSKSPAIQNS